MSVAVAPEDPRAEEVQALIARAEAEIAPFYPPEQMFTYSPEDLIERGVFFVVARLDDVAVGCGGTEPKDGYGELKRMYVAPEARGRGAAEAIMCALEAGALGRGLKVMRLETGIFQHAALKFYPRCGYETVACWGEYADSDTSVCMEKRLGAN
jgi:putative acetyltransferase